jgi:probable HAF family extracellular repeat protein
MGVKGLAASAVVVMAAGVCASAAQAQPAGLWIIDGPPGTLTTGATRLSADGMVAGGLAGFGSWTWTRAGGRVDLPRPGGVEVTLTGLNGDGAIAVGIIGSGATGRAFRREGTGSYQELGGLPGLPRTSAQGVSRDGRVVVGRAQDGVTFGGAAFRWTQETGMTDLGRLRPSDDEVIARAASADGSVVVGNSRNTGGFGTAFVWQNGVMSELPRLGGQTGATSVTGDGRYVGGGADVVGAVIWDTLTGTARTGLGFMNVTALSDDARTAVGAGLQGGPVVWRERLGVVTLADYAAGFGFTLPPGAVFTGASALSADGRTIAGTVNLPGGQFGQNPRAFVLTIPTPSALGLLGFAGLLASRRRR